MLLHIVVLLALAGVVINALGLKAFTPSGFQSLLRDPFVRREMRQCRRGILVLAVLYTAAMAAVYVAIDLAFPWFGSRVRLAAHVSGPYGIWGDAGAITHLIFVAVLSYRSVSREIRLLNADEFAATPEGPRLVLRGKLVALSCCCVFCGMVGSFVWDLNWEHGLSGLLSTYCFRLLSLPATVIWMLVASTWAVCVTLACLAVCRVFTWRVAAIAVCILFCLAVQKACLLHLVDYRWPFFSTPPRSALIAYYLVPLYMAAVLLPVGRLLYGYSWRHFARVLASSAASG